MKRINYLYCELIAHDVLEKFNVMKRKRNALILSYTALSTWDREYIAILRTSEKCFLVVDFEQGKRLSFRDALGVTRYLAGVKMLAKK